MPRMPITTPKMIAATSAPGRPPACRGQSHASKQYVNCFMACSTKRGRQAVPRKLIPETINPPNDSFRQKLISATKNATD